MVLGCKWVLCGHIYWNGTNEYLWAPPVSIWHLACGIWRCQKASPLFPNLRVLGIHHCVTTHTQKTSNYNMMNITKAVLLSGSYCKSGCNVSRVLKVHTALEILQAFWQGNMMKILDQDSQYRTLSVYSLQDHRKRMGLDLWWYDHDVAMLSTEILEEVFIELLNDQKPELFRGVFWNFGFGGVWIPLLYLNEGHAVRCDSYSTKTARTLFHTRPKLPKPFFIPNQNCQNSFVSQHPRTWGRK